MHITFIANGIGDTEEDYILKTDINKNDVSFSAINISNYTGELVDIKKYDIQYWENNAKDKHHNKDSLLLIIINIVKHRYFILGFSLGFFIVSVLSVSYFFNSSKG